MPTRQQRADYADALGMLTRIGRQLADPTGRESAEDLRALSYGFACLYREAEALKVQVKGKPFEAGDIKFELDEREETPAYLASFHGIELGALTAATGWFGEINEASDQPGWVIHFDDELFAVLGLHVPINRMLDIEIPVQHRLDWQKVAWVFSPAAYKQARGRATGQMIELLSAAVEQR